MNNIEKEMTRPVVIEPLTKAEVRAIATQLGKELGQTAEEMGVMPDEADDHIDYRFGYKKNSSFLRNRIVHFVALFGDEMDYVVYGTLEQTGIKDVHLSFYGEIYDIELLQKLLRDMQY